MMPAGFRKLLLFCAVLLIVSLLPGEENQPNFAEIRPRALVRDELTVVFSRGRVELDFRKSYMASEAQLFTAIYEGLFSHHPRTMQPVPALAESWVLSEDRRQWTFTIRENARFWNGDPVTAEDFRASWLSLISPERNSPYSSSFDIIVGARDFRNGLEKNPDNVGIIAAGPRTLIVRLNSPAAFFPAMLCHHSFAPIHPSMIDKEDWSPGGSDWTPPMSNGPFRISAMDENRMILLRNEYYWDAGQVSLNKITIIFAETGEAAANLWNSGQAHWIAGNVNFEALTDRSGIHVNPMFATHYYFIRSAQEPWNDYRIRRALVLALPWEEIRRGHFIPARTLVFPIFGYPDIEGLYRTDLDESLRLLTEAGFSGGYGLPELVIRITPSQEAARIAGIMASTWNGQLGVPVRVEVIPFEYYLQSLTEDNYGVGSSTWIGDFADPLSFLKMWRNNSNLNNARLNDPDFEDLMERSMFEEGEARFELLAQAEQLLLDRGTVLPISHVPAVNVVDLNELAGWYPNILNIHPFKYISFRAFRPLPGVVLGK